MRASKAEWRDYTHASHKEGQAVILRMYDGYPFSLLGYASKLFSVTLREGEIRPRESNWKNSKFILLLKLKNIFLFILKTSTYSKDTSFINSLNSSAYLSTAFSSIVYTALLYTYSYVSYVTPKSVL